MTAEVEEVVVDRCSRQQDHLLAPPFSASAAVCAQQGFQVRVPLGIAVAEVVGFVDQDDIRVCPG